MKMQKKKSENSKWKSNWKSIHTNLVVVAVVVIVGCMVGWQATLFNVVAVAAAVMAKK